MQNKVKIPFVKNKSRVPVIKFRLKGGKEGYSVVDTGSESTVFDMQFVKKNKSCFDVEITEDKMNLVGLTDSSETPLIYATTHVCFRECPEADITVKGIVMDLSRISPNIGHPTAALIGGDVLTKIRAKVNYDRQLMSLYYDLPD